MSATLCDEYCMLFSLRRGLSFHIGRLSGGISRALQTDRRKPPLKPPRLREKSRKSANNGNVVYYCLCHCDVIKGV